MGKTCLIFTHVSLMYLEIFESKSSPKGLTIGRQACHHFVVTFSEAITNWFLFYQSNGE
jgi:hypothetical protein